MSFFYVLYIPGEELGGCIDAIRFLANPSVKHRAHITVRGPYERPTPVDKLNQSLAGNVVTVTDVGRFVGDRQQTVFLDCDGTRLRAVWWKRDFGYHPHITLYDGADMQLAEAIAAAAARFRYQLRFVSDRLELLESRPGRPATGMAAYFDGWLSDLVRTVTGQSLRADEVCALSAVRRLRLLEGLLEHLAGLSGAFLPGQAPGLPGLEVAGRASHISQA